MLDAKPPLRYVAKRPIHQRLGVHAGQFMRADLRGKTQYLTRRVNGLIRRVRPRPPAAPAPPGSAVPLRSAVALDDRWEAMERMEGEADMPEALQRMIEASRVARANYAPPLYPGAIHLFRAAERPRWLEHHRADYGWGLLAKGGVVIHEVSGSHTNLLEAVHAEALAQRIRLSLDELNV